MNVLDTVAVTVLDTAQLRFTHAVAELHASLAALQAAMLGVSVGSPSRSSSSEEWSVGTVRISEAARIVGVSRQTIHRMIRSGRLQAIKSDGHVARVRVDDLTSIFGGERIRRQTTD